MTVKVRYKGGATLSYQILDVLESDSPIFEVGANSVQYASWAEGDTILHGQTLYQMTNIQIGEPNENGYRLATFNIVPV